MPFEAYVPRPFTASAIRAFAPAASGIYGLSNAKEWIYIGVTDNINGELLWQLQQGAEVLRKQTTGFVFETCDSAARTTRLSRLKSEYHPLYQAI